MEEELKKGSNGKDFRRSVLQTLLGSFSTCLDWNAWIFWSFSHDVCKPCQQPAWRAQFEHPPAAWYSPNSKQPTKLLRTAVPSIFEEVPPNKLLHFPWLLKKLAQNHTLYMLSWLLTFGASISTLPPGLMAFASGFSSTWVFFRITSSIAESWQDRVEPSRSARVVLYAAPPSFESSHR